jgi:hypothetical protein
VLCSKTRFRTFRLGRRSRRRRVRRVSWGCEVYVYSRWVLRGDYLIVCIQFTSTSYKKLVACCFQRGRRRVHGRRSCGKQSRSIGGLGGWIGGCMDICKWIHTGRSVRSIGAVHVYAVVQIPTPSRRVSAFGGRVEAPRKKPPPSCTPSLDTAMCVSISHVHDVHLFV